MKSKIITYISRRQKLLNEVVSQKNLFANDQQYINTVVKISRLINCAQSLLLRYL
jgi:hypothetical protein